MTATISKLVASCRKWLGEEVRSGLLSFTLEAAPTPASRPRVTRWGTYYAKGYQTFLKDAGVAMARDSLAKVKAQTDRPIVAVLEIVAERPKTTKRDFPRGDIDNYAKGPLDVFTKAEAFYQDDDQIVGLCAFKRFATPGEEPHINFHWTTL